MEIEEKAQIGLKKTLKQNPFFLKKIFMFIEEIFKERHDKENSCTEIKTLIMNQGRLHPH